MARDEMMFKNISIYSSDGNFSANQNHLCTFSRGHYEEHFCEIIFNFDQTIPPRQTLLTRTCLPP